jgi:hypothetical protein
LEVGEHLNLGRRQAGLFYQRGGPPHDVGDISRCRAELGGDHPVARVGGSSWCRDIPRLACSHDPDLVVCACRVEHIKSAALEAVQQALVTYYSACAQ